MGTLRKLRSEGMIQHRADELDQMDLAHKVPREGVTVVLDDGDTGAASVKFLARRSNFMEQIRKAWHQYKSHPQFNGQPALVAIEVPRDHDRTRFGLIKVHSPREPRDGYWVTKIWWVNGEVETQERANNLWQAVVETWGEYMARFER